MTAPENHYTYYLTNTTDEKFSETRNEATYAGKTETNIKVSIRFGTYGSVGVTF